MTFSRAEVRAVFKKAGLPADMRKKAEDALAPYLPEEKHRTEPWRMPAFTLKKDDSQAKK